MISKAKIKLIQSLKNKKYRIKNGLFVVEGKKSILDLLYAGMKAVHIFSLNNLIDDFSEADCFVDEVSYTDIKKISLLSTPSNSLAIFKIPEYDLDATYKDNFLLALDNVQDPGNFGTIIRTADWFGIKHIVCSLNTVDVFNPKVVQASMGSIARVRVYYLDLFDYLKSAQDKFTLYGSFMEGKSIYKTSFQEKKILIMGNEGNGISPEIKNLINEKVSIPIFTTGNSAPESLNVAMASGIIISEIKRKSKD